MKLQGWDFPEAGEMWWHSSWGWSPSVPGSLGCTEWGAEEEVLPFMWGSGRIAGSSALEHITSPLRVQGQECWVVLQVAPADHLIGKKQQMRPSNSWREAPVCSWSPWRSLTPSVPRWGRCLAEHKPYRRFLECFCDSRNWFAGLLPCLQGKINHECEDGGRPFRGTLAN